MQRGGETALEEIGGHQIRDAYTDNIGKEETTVHARSLQGLQGDLQRGGQMPQPVPAWDALTGLPAGDHLPRHRIAIRDLAQFASQPRLRPPQRLPQLPDEQTEQHCVGFWPVWCARFELRYS